MFKAFSTLGFGLVGFGIVAGFVNPSQGQAACVLGSVILVASAVLTAGADSVR